MTDDIAQHSLTAQGLFDAQQWNNNTRLLLRASCGCRQCYRVVTYGTLKQKLRRGRDALLCPAHCQACNTFSRWVYKFYQTTVNLHYDGVVVWDWNDVPGNMHMHWDATLFVGGLAHRFEIDGPVHDLINGERRHRDVAKDGIVIQVGTFSILRLKHQDFNVWLDAIVNHMQNRLVLNLVGVWGTEWYAGFEHLGNGPLVAGFMHMI